MSVVHTRIYDSDHSIGISTGDPPGRRRRHRRGSPLCDISIVGAGVGRTVVGIVRHESLDCLYGGVELGELDVRSVAQVAEHSDPQLGRYLQVGDSEGGDFADNLRTERGVQSISDILAGWRLES